MSDSSTWTWATACWISTMSAALSSGRRVLRCGGAGFGAQDLALGVAFGISHANSHQETIELRLGQGIGAVVLDGILSGNDQERLRQRIGMRVDGDLAFVHSFEQGGLRLGSGPLDFVG